MKYKIIFITSVCVLSIAMTNCNSPKKQTTKIDSVKSDTLKKETVNINELITKIDKKRAEIESYDLKPIEIKTDKLREKIKQKWSKIHYYLKEDKIVRIKTYPYPNISKRTEEFYIDNNSLILAVIEDNGEGNKGKPKEKLDKIYYFDNEKLISENKSSSEKEYSIKNSDGEEVLSEYREYIDIFNQQKK